MNQMCFTIFSFEEYINKALQLDLIVFCQKIGLIPKEKKCEVCNVFCNINKYSKGIDGYAWRCINRKCKKFKIYVSIRKESFFNSFNISIGLILKIILRYASRQPRHSIALSYDISKSTIKKIIRGLVDLIPKVDFSSEKLGGIGSIVQVDETMLNYKCKGHRGRLPKNRTNLMHR